MTTGYLGNFQFNLGPVPSGSGVHQSYVVTGPPYAVQGNNTLGQTYKGTTSTYAGVPTTTTTTYVGGPTSVLAPVTTTGYATSGYTSMGIVNRTVAE